MKPSKFRLMCLLASCFPAAALADGALHTWNVECAKCHGASGDGRTKEGLKIRAKDYTDPKVQSAFTDTGLLKNLLLGVNAPNGDVRMPSYKDKMTVVEAKEMIALIRSFNGSK